MATLAPFGGRKIEVSAQDNVVATSNIIAAANCFTVERFSRKASFAMQESQQISGDIVTDFRTRVAPGSGSRKPRGWSATRPAIWIRLWRISLRQERNNSQQWDLVTLTAVSLN